MSMYDILRSLSEDYSSSCGVEKEVEKKRKPKIGPIAISSGAQPANLKSRTFWNLFSAGAALDVFTVLLCLV